jgi:hypothetical protein
MVKVAKKSTVTTIWKQREYFFGTNQILVKASSAPSFFSAALTHTLATIEKIISLQVKKWIYGV